VLIALAICLQDRASPFYVAPRVGHEGSTFNMVKFRSMIVGADKTGVSSTGASDRRLTPLGTAIRRYKLDELPQLWNVLKGEMSLVGPRPNVRSEVDRYTPMERRILDVRPGISDLASIVFSDEGEILRGSADPDLDYNRLIRPWKSRLALFYVSHQRTFLDLQVLRLTLLNTVSRRTALVGIERLLARCGTDDELRRVCRRQTPLKPSSPPGADVRVEAIQ
jgi:lipopolysaccharide/colanic/teichoic acid biosynthesis glycosyltransferase